MGSWCGSPLVILAFARLATASFEGLQVYKDCVATQCTSLSVIGQASLGTLPTEIGDLVSLASLVLHDDALTGTLPTELGSLTELTDLRLHGNSFRGGIPTQLGRLSALQSLSLASNSLTGAIPSEWAKLTALTRLSAAWNQLGGTVPAEVWSNWPALRTLELQGNQLSGILPEEIENVDKLEELVLSLNLFSGYLPPALAELKGLKKLLVEANLFSGAVPSEIGALPLEACHLTLPAEVVGEDLASHPFNTFWKPLPPSIEAKCTVHWTVPFHLPHTPHKDCTMCLRHRCTLWGMNKCAARKGFTDPQRHEKEACMCACCAEECNVDPHHTVGGCPGENNKPLYGPAESTFYAPGMAPVGKGKGRGSGHPALLAERPPASAAPRPSVAEVACVLIVALAIVGSIGVVAARVIADRRRRSAESS